MAPDLLSLLFLLWSLASPLGSSNEHCVDPAFLFKLYQIPIKCLPGSSLGFTGWEETLTMVGRISNLKKDRLREETHTVSGGRLEVIWAGFLKQGLEMKGRSPWPWEGHSRKDLEHGSLKNIAQAQVINSLILKVCIPRRYSVLDEPRRLVTLPGLSVVLYLYTQLFPHLIPRVLAARSMTSRQDTRNLPLGIWSAQEERTKYLTLMISPENALKCL